MKWASWDYFTDDVSIVIKICFFKTQYIHSSYMDCNHAQQQGNKIAVNPVEVLLNDRVSW